MKLNSTLLVLVGGLWLGGAALVHAQAFSVIKSFGVAGNVTGCNPACELVQDGSGALYGTTSGGSGTLFSLGLARAALSKCGRTKIKFSS